MAEKSLAGRRASWLFPAVIVAAQALTLALSPEERTLGVGIKPVYLHVSLTWAGMLLLAVCGALGLGLAISQRERLDSWLKTALAAGWGLYIFGFLVSILASYVNWGGVPFKEPRVLGSLNVLVVATVALVLVNWINLRRINGLIGMAPAAVMIFSMSSSRMALHPEGPVSSSPLGIRLTFFGMFLLALLLGGWGVHFLRKRQTDSKQAGN